MMNPVRIGMAVAVAIVLGAGAAFVSTQGAEPESDVTINLVTFNDFHGQIDQTTVQWAVTVKQLLAEAPEESSLLISAGDNVGTSSEASAAQQDGPALDVLNELGVDVAAVGNHEFDRGWADLAERIVPHADFPILATNVRDAKGEPVLETSVLREVSGVRVAVVGAVTRATPYLLNRAGVKGLYFLEPVAAINREVEQLMALPYDERPQVVVVSIHEGAPWGTWKLDQAMRASTQFRHIVKRISPEVDVIVTGHTHNHYVFDGPVPGDDRRTRPIIQSGYHGLHVGQVKLTVDPSTGDVTGYTARNVERSTETEQALLELFPELESIAKIRDAAVATAAAG